MFLRIGYRKIQNSQKSITARAFFENLCHMLLERCQLRFSTILFEFKIRAKVRSSRTFCIEFERWELCWVLGTSFAFGTFSHRHSIPTVLSILRAAFTSISSCFLFFVCVVRFPLAMRGKKSCCAALGRLSHRVFSSYLFSLSSQLASIALICTILPDLFDLLDAKQFLEMRFSDHPLIQILHLGARTHLRWRPSSTRRSGYAAPQGGSERWI